MHGAGAVGKDEAGAETGPSLKITCATIKTGASFKDTQRSGGGFTFIVLSQLIVDAHLPLGASWQKFLLKHHRKLLGR